MASEMGVLPAAEEKIIEKWRLQPGKMLLIDLEEGRIISDDELKAERPARIPMQWLARGQIKLEELPVPTGDAHVQNDLPLLTQQQAFGYSQKIEVSDCPHVGKRRGRHGLNGHGHAAFGFVG